MPFKRNRVTRRQHHGRGSSRLLWCHNSNLNLMTSCPNVLYSIRNSSGPHSGLKLYALHLRLHFHALAIYHLNGNSPLILVTGARTFQLLSKCFAIQIQPHQHSLLRSSPDGERYEYLTQRLFPTTRSHVQQILRAYRSQLPLECRRRRVQIQRPCFITCQKQVPNPREDSPGSVFAKSCITASRCHAPS